MDWTALGLSGRLAITTVLILLPGALLLARWLAHTRFRGKAWIEGLLALPLVLPPTVLGYYLLLGMGNASALGQAFSWLTGTPLAFSFSGLLLASVLVNIPFAVQPMQRAFEGIAQDVLEASACCGMTPLQSLLRVELPLAWPGILGAAVMTFAHTLGEFGVVLMVGGSIPGETRTVAIAIYDRVQAFDTAAAGRMSALLLAICLLTIVVSYVLTAHMGRRRG